MKPDKIIHNLEKIIEKLENISHLFSTGDLQDNFDSNKKDVIELLQDMIETCEYEELLENDGHDEWKLPD